MWYQNHENSFGISLSSFLRFLDHTQRRIKFGRIPLDEWSARRRDLYLTTHTTFTTDKHPCPPVRFEPTISAGERPQTYALDRAATGTGVLAPFRPNILVQSTIYWALFRKTKDRHLVGPKAGDDEGMSTIFSSSYRALEWYFIGSLPPFKPPLLPTTFAAMRFDQPPPPPPFPRHHKSFHIFV